MTNRSVEPRFQVYSGITIDGRPLPYQSGALPEDFSLRIERLKEASGLTWNGFALAIGVDRQQVRWWRKEGLEPSGGPMLSLFRFAAQMPGGLENLMGEDFQVKRWEEAEEA